VSTHEVRFGGSGIPQTVLPAETDDVSERLATAAALTGDDHRGLDALRQNGWRGSGYVKWEHPTNRPFLRCLSGLQERAAEIGEDDEAERCALFLRQREPTWPPADQG